MLTIAVLSTLVCAQSGPAIEVPLRVLSVEPSINAVHVSRLAPIRIRFNQAIDPQSIGPRSLSIMGRWTAFLVGVLDIQSNGKDLVFAPTQPFSAGDLVTVSISKNLRSMKGSRLARAFTFSYWVQARASTSTFSISQTLSPGNVPYGAYGGDLDSDGDLDLAITNEGSKDLAVYLNDGTGTFLGPTSFPAGQNCSPNESGDLNLDGKLDLVVANILDNDVSVFLGNGDGTFRPQVRYPMGSQPRGLALLDVEGDGDLDIVTANRQSSDLTLRRNNGDGTYGPVTLLEAGMNGETALGACDMNNDGTVDLVVGGYTSNQLAVLLSNGDGTFQSPMITTIGSRPWKVAWGDANGDGLNDACAALSAFSAFAIAFNDGTGKLVSPASYPTGSFPISITMGDVDGNGALDIGISCYSGNVFHLYRNNGAGIFGNRVDLPSQSSGSCMTLHDVDGDADLDITALDEVAHKGFIFRQSG